MPKTECQNISCAGYNFGSDGNCIRFKDVDGCPKLVSFPENFIDESVGKSCKNCGQEFYIYCTLMSKCGPNNFSYWIPKSDPEAIKKLSQKIQPNKQEKSALMEIIRDLVAIIKSQQELLVRSKN